MKTVKALSRHWLATLLLTCAAALGGTPDADANTAEELRMVGEARLKVLFWSVYDSRLYTVDGSYSEGQLPLRLEIEYLIDIPAARLVERTLTEWQAMEKTHPRQGIWLAELELLWPDISAGDVLTLDIAADGSSVFYRNGVLLGSVSDPDFGSHFADIWLSAESSRPELRLALIGSADD